MLRRFGFSERFIDLVQRSLDNNWFSVIINGKQAGFFKASRGLKQGDPLSPSLFILAQEVFSRGVSSLVQRGLCKRYATSGKGISPSHLFFADDALLFCRADSISLSNLMGFIARYELFSGQRLGRSKCNYFWRHPMTRNVINEHHTSFILGSWPLYYLGAPIALGRFKGCFIRPLVEKIRKRIEGWCYKFLIRVRRPAILRNL